ncbi:MAG: isoleucine--tRNA ligase [Gemmatimonadota bacterium]|jgi:isoleucyl-tRNA synthetase|nr:isoleucine--tRNA ligase [Gemmatimonadota bacterium]
MEALTDRAAFPDLPRTTGALEEETLAAWSAEDTFRRSLEQTKDGEPFVFYEGPPTANGRPGIHHVISRTIKDAVARYRTMQGRYVPRIAGWDTHGLPVEIEAERRLKISGKPEIEKIGIARFNEVCRESVLTYTEEWERFSARIGYWLDYSKPYVTYRPEYIESIWWSLKEIADKGLFYRGHKILPYCPRCGTGLSSHEVALGYKDVLDPSLYFTARVIEEGDANRHFLVWTTTPWTLLSNVALAIDPDLEYAEVAHEGRRLILAKARVPALFGAEAEIVAVHRGAELVGLRYERPFDWVDGGLRADNAWRVLPANYVSAEDGTGVVHTAPAYGADDYTLGVEFDLPVLRPVDDRGNFPSDFPEGVGGRFVKDADVELVKRMKERGLVFRYSRDEHSYPHCWRCQSPLLYMARDSWFIRTTSVRDDLLANNARVTWYPPEVGSGRFGEWLENNVDWAISRNRYWGTPLPAWVCSTDPEHLNFIGSFAELREKAGSLPEPFDPHRPFIDELSWKCDQPGCDGRMHRTPEVIDVWYDSGAMPFAQWHYPFENVEEGEKYFPADFICEGVDQTRGWFYSLMAISTLLGRGPAYRNVVVNDLILDAEGQKMSKSRGNVVNPWDAIEEFGADAIRWYLLSSSHPWLPKRFDPSGVREVHKKVFETLKSTYHFLSLYANLEGWKPGAGDVPEVADRPLIDRWLLSRLAEVAERVATQFDEYNLTHGVREVADFIVDDLSNWYVRRSRDRFWGGADQVDTRSAFATLHKALVDVTRLMAPVAPFLSDWLHRALTGESVHLAGFADPAVIRDPELEAGMEAVRRLSSLGRAARDQAGIRVRQPLGRLLAVVPAGITLEPALLEILRDELNVRSVELIEGADELVTFSARPNFRALGARYGKLTPRIAEAARSLGSAALSAFRSGQPLEVEVDGERYGIIEGEIEILQTATGEYLVEAQGGYTVALDPVVTPELKAEGLARELVSRIQRLRKETGFAVSDRIRLAVAAPAEMHEAFESHREFIMGETLALEMTVTETLDDSVRSAVRSVDLEGGEVVIGVLKIEPLGTE